MNDKIREYNLNVYAQNWAATEHAETLYTKEITNVISSRIRDGASVLEIGVGTGVPFASSMLHKGFDVTGVDLSADLAKLAAGIVTEDGRSVKTVEGDSERLPFADDTFDLVYSISSTWYFQDIQTAISEMARVTKPGGVIAFDILNSMHSSTSVTYWASKFARLARLVVSRIARKPAPPVINWSIRTSWGIRKQIRKAGLNSQMYGYLVLLPVSLPRLGERVNMAGRISLFATGLKSTPIINSLGAKLLFVCTKEGRD